MTDLDPILPLWRDLRDSGTEYVLGTVVMVDGSGYRKPGARILIGADGRRAGTISGGCLEGEVARKAFWHTENGPVVRSYSTRAELGMPDNEIPFGMGCGGVVHLLLERSTTADAALARLAASFDARQPTAIATILEGEFVGKRAFWPPEDLNPLQSLRGQAVDAGANLEQDLEQSLAGLARRGFEEQSSFSESIRGLDGRMTAVRVEWNAARPGLFVFGAGDDAIPLVRLARQMGWYVAIADGRSNLATKARFPEAHDVEATFKGRPIALDARPTDAAVVMTHSLEQDTRFLRVLLPRFAAGQFCYVGVLGPRRRTREILISLATDLGLGDSIAERQAEIWMEGIHSPLGLDLGGDTPADVALSAMAEIQQRRHGASGLSLREIRGVKDLRQTLTASVG